MTTVGIEVRNASGNLCIDGTYKNLVFVTKGVATTTTVQDNFSYVSINLNGLSGYPLVAVSAAGGAWATVRSYSNGAAVVDIVAHGPVGTSLTYYVFALPTNLGDSAGLQIFNAVGELVFSAEHRYMRVVGSIAATAGPGSPPASLTLPAGKTYAVFQTTPMAYAQINDLAGIPGQHDWQLTSIRGCFAVSSNVISKIWDEFQIVHYGPTQPPGYNQAATGFVLDVTNY